jgi:hypothetical protein
MAMKLAIYRQFLSLLRFSTLLALFLLLWVTVISILAGAKDKSRPAKDSANTSRA